MDAETQRDIREPIRKAIEAAAACNSEVVRQLSDLRIAVSAIVDRMTEEKARLLDRLAEAKAAAGTYEPGSDLVNAAMAAVALKSNDTIRLSYVLKRGWLLNSVVGLDKGDLTGMPLDGAMDVQVREDIERFRKLL